MPSSARPRARAARDRPRADEAAGPEGQSGAAAHQHVDVGGRGVVARGRCRRGALHMRNRARAVVCGLGRGRDGDGAGQRGRDEQSDEGLHDNPRSEDEQTDASTVGPGPRAVHLQDDVFRCARSDVFASAARYSDGGVARLEPRLRRPRGRAGRARRRDGGGARGHAGPRARGRRGRRGQEPARRGADRARRRATAIGSSSGSASGSTRRRSRCCP